MNLKAFSKPLIVLLIGILCTVLGATFKIMHWPSAGILLLIGTVLEFLAILYAIILLIKVAKKNS